MTDPRDNILGISDSHLTALGWFVDKQNKRLSWLELSVKGSRLAIQFKGIYKPKGTNYALSVRHSVGSSYLDYGPRFRPDGTWSYRYHQENTDPDKRDTEFTNRALVKCMEDGIPVGVIRQVRVPPNPRYEILGLAFVVGWKAGYFQFEGFSADGKVDDALNASRSTQDDESSTFEDSVDERQRTVASVVRRIGQTQFRGALIEAYDGKCAISGCTVEAALEAAHIRRQALSVVAAEGSVGGLG